MRTADLPCTYARRLAPPELATGRLTRILSVYLPLWLAIWTGLLLCLAAPAALAQRAGYEVVIDVRSPEEDVKERNLQELLRDNLDIVRWRDHPAVDEDQLQRLYRNAPQQIGELLATEGFYAPAIQPSIAQEGGRWRARFDIDTGPAVRVGSVEIDIKGAWDEQQAAQFRDNWTLKSGEVFRQADWEQAKRSLLRQAVRERTPRAQLTDTQATVDPSALKANLHVALESGPVLHFGELTVQGLNRYPESVVANLNPIKPGDPYSETALQTFQAKLQETGYFAGVDVYADLDAAAEDALVPVQVRVNENRSKRLGVGLGFSTNTGNRAQLSFDDLSLLGLRFKSALTLETKRQSARGDFFFPVTPDGYTHSIGAAVERSNIKGELTRLASLTGRRSWGSPALERSLTLEYVNEQRQISGDGETLARSVPLTYSITWRRTDNTLFPTSGYLLNTQLGVAPLPVLTDRQFVRGYFKGIKYIPLNKRTIVLLRGEGGIVSARSREGIPSTYLFRAGGDQSVRGYAYQELGVRQGTAVVGGRYLAVASAETQYWFLPEWGAAAFIDAGNAADQRADLHPRIGYGLGARWKSPVGPVNLDVAYGRSAHQVRLHFSLGFLF